MHIYHYSKTPQWPRHLNHRGVHMEVISSQSPEHLQLTHFSPYPGNLGHDRNFLYVSGSCEHHSELTEVCLFVGCLTSQQHASVSQGWICSDNFTCCHTEIEVADQTFYLTQSQYTDTRLTSPSADPITPGAWQGSHWSANF